MKKIMPYILVIILFLMLVGCSSSRKNELVYRFVQNESSVSVDSLRMGLLDTPGLEMLAMYPDSDVVIIHYDRYRTHQEKIEIHFVECGYDYQLLEKSPLKEIE